MLRVPQISSRDIVVMLLLLMKDAQMNAPKDTPSAWVEIEMQTLEITSVIDSSILL